MTVCIVAICRWDDRDYIVATTDRQLTADDIAFEPGERTKLWSLGSNMLILQSGNEDAYVAIAKETERLVLERGLEDVAEAAKIYSREFVLLRRRRTESRYLAPLGLDIDSFVERQNSMRPEIAAQLIRELQLAELEVETIIAGVDSTGPHIYKIKDPGYETCEDGVGFASVGEGSWHAESVFMVAGYNARWPANKAIVLAYMAKKRAELASSVGATTDIFIAYPEGNPIRSSLAYEFGERYLRRMHAVEGEMNNAIEELSEFATAILKGDQA